MYRQSPGALLKKKEIIKENKRNKVSPKTHTRRISGKGKVKFARVSVLKQLTKEDHGEYPHQLCHPVQLPEQSSQSWITSMLAI